MIINTDIFKNLSEYKQRRVAFIVNPVAKNGYATQFWFNDIRYRAQNRFYKRMKEYITKGPGDATFFAMDAIKEGYDVIVSVGGDGTHKEVVNGYMNADGLAKKVMMTIFPVGTDSNLEKTVFKNSTDSEENILDLIDEGDARELDICCIKTTKGQQYFINACSVGYTGMLTKVRTDNNRSSIFDKMYNVWDICKKTVTWVNPAVKYKLDDDEWITSTVSQIFIFNGKYYNGSVCVVPNACMHDGKLDVVVFGDMNYKDLGVVKNFYNRSEEAEKETAVDNNKISFSRCSTITILSEMDVEVDIEVDGNYVGVTPVTITVVPQAVLFLKPL